MSTPVDSRWFNSPLGAYPAAPPPLSRRAVVAGMLGVASQIGGKVIAEGVENREELDVLIELGVERAQGFHLGVPGPLTGQTAA